jgi:uncharacterized protein with ATP-grasp and redox domains
MRTYLDCYPCFLRQALEAARLTGADDNQQKAILDQVLQVLRRSELSSTPPEIGDAIHRLVRQARGDGDPYLETKEASTRQALACYPRLRELVQNAGDALDVAVRLSIAGNIIDSGPDQQYDLWNVIERVLAQPFAVDDMTAFRKALAAADRVLYLADNAGETVFDRVLIEVLGIPVVYAVKGGPVLNDATLEDALAAGLDQVADVVETGSDAPGTILGRCPAKFRQLYDEAEMVVAKGQANYETLSEAGPKVFFLLQTKCPVIARDAGVTIGSILLRQGRLGAEAQGESK